VTAFFRLSTLAAAAVVVVVVVAVVVEVVVLVVVVLVVVTHLTLTLTQKDCLQKMVGGRGMLQIEGTYRSQLINNTEYLNIKYKKDQFVNIVKKKYENCASNMNSTFKISAKL
jgi:hypothetical protein